mmetsp:Transcript_12301/g.37240  ORF Transcript_12301/g.37240 Transcript_12301/m.37240 type:complete len:204 (+) Transcript_12301:246-857(+)
MMGAASPLTNPTPDYTPPASLNRVHVSRTTSSTLTIRPRLCCLLRPAPRPPSHVVQLRLSHWSLLSQLLPVTPPHPPLQPPPRPPPPPPPPPPPSLSLPRRATAEWQDCPNIRCPGMDPYRQRVPTPWPVPPRTASFPLLTLPRGGEAQPARDPLPRHPRRHAITRWSTVWPREASFKLVVTMSLMGLMRGHPVMMMMKPISF